jgi:hypothetical protein
MAKKPVPTPKRKPVPGPAQREFIASALPWVLGLPGQVRLSAREQRPPPPFVPPKGKGRKGR